MHIKALGPSVNPARIQPLVAHVRHRLLHFVELQILMGLGALGCLLVVQSVSGAFGSVYESGTYAYAIGDVFFLTVPVVAWMSFRGNGRRSLEMAIAMVAPLIALALGGEFFEYDYLTLLITAGYPIMSLGMLDLSV